MSKKVLIVEDDPDTREMMARLLELEGWSVFTAEDGDSGLKVAAAERPDLILTDINMPRISGIEMIRLLRAKPDFHRLPIVALTAYGERVAREALEAGADRYFCKPFDYDSLLDHIKSLIARPHAFAGGLTA